MPQDPEHSPCSEISPNPDFQGSTFHERKISYDAQRCYFNILPATSTVVAVFLLALIA